MCHCSLMAGSLVKLLVQFLYADWWRLSVDGSLRGRHVPPHDGVGSVGLVMSRTRSI
jgi:hypothetical protein